MKEWSTSTQVGHPYPHPFHAHHRTTQLPPCELFNCHEDATKCKLLEATYTTTQRAHYTLKSPYINDEVKNQAPSSLGVHYVNSFLRKPTRWYPPRPLDEQLSTYQREFMRKRPTYSSMPNENCPLNAQEYFMSKPPRKEGQPATDLAGGGVSVHTNPYISSSLLIHRPFNHTELSSNLLENARRKKADVQ